MASVASQSELEELTERLDASVAVPVISKPAPASSAAPSAAPSAAELQKELLALVRAAVEKAWPAAPPLEDVTVASGAGGLTVTVTYGAAKDLDATSVALIERDLGQALKVPGVTLQAKRIAPQAKRMRKPRK